MDNQNSLYDLQVSSISRVVEIQPDPSWSITNHCNDNQYTLGYAIRGRAAYSLPEDIRFNVSQGDILFFKKNMIHSGKSDPENPWHFYSAVFDLAISDPRTNEAINQIPTLSKISNETMFYSLIKQLHHAWVGKRSYSLIACRSIIMQAMITLLKTTESAGINPTHYQAVENVITLLQNDFTQRYSSEQLAQLCGLSYSYFRTLFSKITGMSPTHYQNSVRINKAKDLLSNGDCNVTEASLSVGIEDIYYFSRLFKKVTGSPPSSFIR